MRSTLITMMVVSVPLMAIDTHGFHNNQDRTLSCNHDGNSNQQRFCEVREQTVPAARSLHIDGKQNGGISVKGWNGSDVLVRAKVESWAPSVDEAKSIVTSVTVMSTGGTVQASGPTLHEHRGWSVSYEVFVPHLTDVHAEAHNGGIHIMDVGGSLEFHTVNGGLTLARVAGDVHGSTVNGGVHLDLMGRRWDGHGLDVSSTNGGVQMLVPNGYSAQLETSTVNGGLNSNLTELAESSHARNHSFAATLGSGGPTVRVTTVNGGVHISHGGEI